jgi:hypothetical protein
MSRPSYTDDEGRCIAHFQGMMPNGLQLSRPAEAGKPSPTLRQAGRRFKHLRRPRPPGQLWRVVGRREEWRLSKECHLELHCEADRRTEASYITEGVESPGPGTLTQKRFNSAIQH